MIIVETKHLKKFFIISVEEIELATYFEGLKVVLW